MRETKILLALTYILVLAACLSGTTFTLPTSNAPLLLSESDSETQPWSALSEDLLN